jgi:Phosphatidylinositol-glycan biosynthesis class S protein.
MDTIQGVFDIISSRGDISLVNRKLNDGIRLLHDIHMDEEMFELPHVPLDQLFAVFGSLLLPLFVPTIKNFISELKRYSSKTKQKMV